MASPSSTTLPEGSLHKLRKPGGSAAGSSDPQAASEQPAGPAQPTAPVQPAGVLAAGRAGEVLLVVGFGEPAAADYAAYARRSRPAAAVATEPGQGGEFGSAVVFLQRRLTAPGRAALDGLAARLRDRPPPLVCLVSTCRVHLGDRAAIAAEAHALRLLEPLRTRVVVFRPGHLLSDHSPACSRLRRLGALFPLVPGRLRSCFVDGDELFAAIERERRRAEAGDVLRDDALRGDTLHSEALLGKVLLGDTLRSDASGRGVLLGNTLRSGIRPRVYTLLGPSRPWRDILRERRPTGPAAGVVTAAAALLSLLLVGHFAAALLGLLARRWPGLRHLNVGTLEPGSFRELLALYNPYNHLHVKVVGYNNGVNHFGQRHPGKTVVSTVRLNRVAPAGSDTIKADCGATVRQALDFLAGSGRDLYVIPNYSYVCLGTAFFVPIHGSAADFSCVADTITRAILYDPRADRLVAATRNDPAFRQRVYDMDADVLLLRLRVGVKAKSRFYLHQEEWTAPDAADLLAALRDERAANVEVRKSGAAQDTVRVYKFYNDADAAQSPVLELPRDRLGRLWDRLEENPVTSYLMHAFGRHCVWHVELFFTAEEFATFWATHRAVPLRKMQFRYIRRDGLPRSPFRDHDCVSVDTFMFRRHRRAFEGYLKRTFPVVRLNPGKHSR